MQLHCGAFKRGCLARSQPRTPKGAAAPARLSCASLSPAPAGPAYTLYMMGRRCSSVSWLMAHICCRDPFHSGLHL